MFRNRDPRARSKSDIDIVSQTAGRLLSSLLSLQGQTTSGAPSSPSTTTTDINKEVLALPMFHIHLLIDWFAYAGDSSFITSSLSGQTASSRHHFETSQC